MQNEIRSKLQLELNKEITEETQVVYILSRVRKILEIDKRKKHYKILKFYCDWALHAEIDNVDPIRKTIDNIIAGSDSAIINLVMAFNNFHIEFRKFLQEYGFSTSIYHEKINKEIFNNLLSQIYTDTPLIIKTTTKKKIIWKAGLGANTGGGAFRIDRIKS